MLLGIDSELCALGGSKVQLLEDRRLALDCFVPRINLSGDGDGLMQSLENDRVSIHQEALEDFASLGYCPEMVATLLQ